MNRQIKILMIVLALSGLIFASIGQAAAQATKTAFSGSEVYVTDVAPGDIFFSDGNMHIRGIVQSFAITVSDPRASGVDTVTINGNFKLVDPPVSFTGPMWGTFSIANAEGSWFGNWTGVRDENGFSFIGGHGEGHGQYEGMKIFLTIERLTPDPTQPETIVGYILEPGN